MNKMHEVKQNVRNIIDKFRQFFNNMCIQIKNMIDRIFKPIIMKYGSIEKFVNIVTYNNKLRKRRLLYEKRMKKGIVKKLR